MKYAAENVEISFLVFQFLHLVNKFQAVCPLLKEKWL